MKVTMIPFVVGPLGTQKIGKETERLGNKIWLVFFLWHIVGYLILNTVYTNVLNIYNLEKKHCW